MPAPERLAGGFGTSQALALLFTSQVWIDYAYAGRPLSWPRAFLVALVDWELWALATPLVAWLCARFPFSRARWACLSRSTCRPGSPWPA